MAIERTLVMVKPSAVARGLIGEVISRLERRGLRLRACKMLLVDEALARRHYAEHEGKPFYEELVQFITSGPVFAMVVEGPFAIKLVRTIMGATDPLEAAPGTIRGDYTIDRKRNVVHGADSPEAAEREIALYFDESELLTYEYFPQDA